MSTSAARILIVDDNHEIHNDFKKILLQQRAVDQNFNALAELFEDAPRQVSSGAAIQIDSAFQCDEAVEMVKQSVQSGQPYSLAFVDVRMPPGHDGIETTRRIWDIDPEVQIVICSAYSDYSWREIVEKLQQSDQFLILKKPFESIEVRQLANALHQRWVLSRTDSATGLINRRALLDFFDKQPATEPPQETTVSCVTLDIDFFKRVNDLHGMECGNRAIKGVADVLTNLCRTGDQVARYGGEEFCVLLQGADESAAVAWAERAREQIKKTTIEYNEASFFVTASFGVAQRTDDNRSPDQLIESSFTALRWAKQSGRDRVCGLSDLAESENSEDGRYMKRPFHSIQTTSLMQPANSITKQTTLRDAAAMLIDKRLSAVPVVDEDGKMVGVLTESDLLRVFSGDQGAELEVQDAMRASVVGFSEDTNLQEIFDFVVRVSIPQVVIVRDGKPRGVIARNSLLRLLYSAGFSKPDAQPAGVPQIPAMPGSVSTESLGPAINR